MKPNLWFLIISVVLVVVSCNQKNKIVSPPQYDFKNPIISKMPDDLKEISGIAFNGERYDRVYAIEDEDGWLYRYEFENGEVKKLKFAKRGDYEDIAFTDSLVIILKSDGTLYTININQIEHEKLDTVIEMKDVLPKGEYESLYMDKPMHQMYTICKNCKGDKEVKKSSGYILEFKPDGEIFETGQFSLNVRDIERLAKVENIHFQPSAMAKNKFTNEWYFLSSANNALVVTDFNFQVKAVYPLPKSAFEQPEGIAFDNEGNLYISDEKSKGTHGDIQKFLFKKPN